MEVEVEEDEEEKEEEEEEKNDVDDKKNVLRWCIDNSFLVVINSRRMRDRHQRRLFAGP